MVSTILSFTIIYTPHSAKFLRPVFTEFEIFRERRVGTNGVSNIIYAVLLLVRSGPILFPVGHWISAALGCRPGQQSPTGPARTPAPPRPPTLHAALGFWYPSLVGVGRSTPRRTGGTRLAEATRASGCHLRSGSTTTKDSRRE